MIIIEELEKIKQYINGLSEQQFDDILFDCGIETIKPSTESDYVQALKINDNNNDTIS